MNIAILGLWHLGCVYASGSAAVNHKVKAWDPNTHVIHQLTKGIPPISEKGLSEQITQGLTSGYLSFHTSLQDAIQDADVVWITFDTPVNDHDIADCDIVIEHIKTSLPLCKQQAVVLISSQLPIGTIRTLEETANHLNRNDLSFACSPENLRLGQAVHLFSHPDRIICGVRNDATKAILSSLWEPLTHRIEWMSVESAEMTKHAINSFLATSVAFANELAVLCEYTCADAKDVERGLKSDSRIGDKAYLGPGMAFSGGTLARDIQFLLSIAKATPQLQKNHEEHRCALLSGVYTSNTHHKSWVIDKLHELLGCISGKTIALWGLTYKPNTNTLRRSAALEYAMTLKNNGAHICAHDPSIDTLQEPYRYIELHTSPEKALENADALVVCTCWDIYKDIVQPKLFTSMRTPIVLDPIRFLSPVITHTVPIQYVAIGFTP